MRKNKSNLSKQRFCFVSNPYNYLLIELAQKCENSKSLVLPVKRGIESMGVRRLNGNASQDIDLLFQKTLPELLHGSSDPVT